MASMTFLSPPAADARSSGAHDASSSAGPAGPGWYDSSWELLRGLDVREGLPGDASVHEWIEHCLRS